MDWKKYHYSGGYHESVGVSRTLPLVDVTLSRSNRSFTTKALIDSGSSMIHINKEVALELGITLENLKGVGSKTIGQDVKGLLSYINIEIKRCGKSFQSDMVIVEGLPFPVLLGQNNFFDHFDIKCQKSKNTFSIKRVK